MANGSAQALEEWRRKVAHAFEAGASVLTPSTVEVTLLGGPEGDLMSRWQVSPAGVEPVDAPSSEPDVSVTVPWNDAIAIVRRELPVAVAYMQGRLKSSGDMARFLELIEWSATPEFDSACQRVTAADA